MATIQNNYRYTITDQLGNLIAQPLGESDFTIEWSRERENGKRQYQRDFGGKITFIKEAYGRLLTLETSIYRCMLQEIRIQKRCGGSWREWFRGHISLNEGDWDLDKCKVTLKFEEAKPDECFDDNKSEPLDLFREITQRERVSIFPGDITIETVTCDYDMPLSGEPEPEPIGHYWCSPGSPEDGRWVVYHHREIIDDLEHRVRTHWARQVTTLSCASTPSPEWTLITDNCASTSTRKYARPATMFGCEYNFLDVDDSQYKYFYEFECKLFGLTGATTQLRNGFRLEKVIDAFVNKFCSGLTVKSDFFQINPENLSSINYVTGAESKVRDIIIFQKSDVKRPTATAGATRAEWTFEKLMQTLKFMFNVDWRIDGNQMIIEHVSFFVKTGGLDLTTQKYSKYIAGKKQYTYKNDEIPAEERWVWKEQQPRGDFPGVPILYNSGCVTKGSKDSIKTYTMEDVITDVEFAMSNPSPDSTIVSDEGFVVTATRPDGVNYSLITEDGIFSDPKPNNSLAMAQLHRDYHKYERPLKVGIMNNVETEFYSALPMKQGARITIPLCCEDNFNPDNLISTPLGEGTVDKATFNFKNSTLDLDLLYESNTGLTPNTSPTAANQAVTTYEDEYIDIDLSIGAVDPDPGASISGAMIVNQPQNGTVTLTGVIARYTPDAGFTGNDIFTFKITDDWGMESNTAIATVTVHPENTPPVANDDFYETFVDESLFVPAPGVFANDSDDRGFELDTYDSTGTLGGSATIGANGELNYTPPAGIEGIDTFTYRIIDEKGLTATATVSVTINSADKPVAVTDEYTTRMNQSATGSPGDPNAPGLLDNDYTPSGTQPLTATAGTFTSAQGGTVVIGADGTFVYIPPTSFTGTDTFNYTVSNSSGSSTGLATINVLPNIYVRMSRTNHRDELLTIACPDGPRPGGQLMTENFLLEFFANAAGTTPINVTSFGLQIVVDLYVKNSESSPWISSRNRLNATGTSMIIEENYPVYHVIRDCAGFITSYTERNIVLIETSHYYTF